MHFILSGLEKQRSKLGSENEPPKIQPLFSCYESCLKPWYKIHPLLLELDLKGNKLKMALQE